MSFHATATHHGHGPSSHSVSAATDDEAGRLVKMGFNPSNHRATEKVKLFMACAAQAVIDARTACYTERVGLTDVVPVHLHPELCMEQDREMAQALARLKEAQMLAVSALHTFSGYRRTEED